MIDFYLHNNNVIDEYEKNFNTNKTGKRFQQEIS